MTPFQKKQAQITLHLFSRTNEPKRPYRVKWPSERPLLWAAVTPGGGKKFVLRTLYKSFLIANIPTGYTVYLGVAREGDHAMLQDILEKNGESFYEKEEWGLTGSGEKLRFMFAATDKIPVVETIIDTYEFEWDMYFLFPFLIAKDEPLGWRDQLERFMKDRVVAEEMIEESYCFITTQYEHAIAIISNKVTREHLENLVGDLATRNGFDLRIVK